MIEGLYNVFLATENVKKLAAFYTKTLKLKVQHECARCVVYDLGQGQHFVILQPSGGQPARKGKDAPVPTVLGTPSKNGGFGLKVADVKAVYSKLKGQFTFNEEPQAEDGGRKTLTGFDPEGNKINFIQELAKKGR